MHVDEHRTNAADAMYALRMKKSLTITTIYIDNQSLAQVCFVSFQFTPFIVSALLKVEPMITKDLQCQYIVTQVK